MSEFLLQVKFAHFVMRRQKKGERECRKKLSLGYFETSDWRRKNSGVKEVAAHTRERYVNISEN